MSAVRLESQAGPSPRTGPGGLPRLLAGMAGAGSSPVSLADHRRLLPPPPSDGARAGLIAAMERAGLRGRGGASFPTATKLRAVADGRRRPVVVVNGAEGEPLSSKDRVLLTLAPHLVIDGALVAAAAVGADRVHLCVETHDDAAQASVRAALGQRLTSEASGVDIRIEPAPAHYVGGEERSLVAWLNGGRAVPTAMPPRPFERGVAGRPTLVHNVETVAHMAQIAAFGPGWFRSMGTPDEPGTMLVSISGAVARPGVAEVAIGTPFPRVMDAAGGVVGPVSAVLVGGYFGTWLDPRQAWSAAMGGAGLRPAGAAPGCGAVMVLPADACGLFETARVTSWLAGQSAGQCGPCVNGLAAIAGAVRRVARGDPSAETFSNLVRWANEVEGRGACRLPDGAVRFLRSALRVFSADVEAHRGGRPCAGAGRPGILPLPKVTVPA